MQAGKAQAARRIAAGAVATLALGGCSVLSPLPSWGLVKVAGTATTVAMATLPATVGLVLLTFGQRLARFLFQEGKPPRFKRLAR